MTNDAHTLPDGAPRLDAALVATGLISSRRKASQAISSGKVDINGEVIRVAGTPVPPDATIAVDWNRAGTGRAQVAARALLTSQQVEIVFEDGDLLVLNKPAGMLTDTATRAQERDAGSLRHLVERYLRAKPGRPMVVHRIDRDTSGLVAFAKSGEMGRLLKSQFAQRSPERVYWCAVHGRPVAETGTFEHWMVWNGPNRIQQRAAPKSSGAVLASAQWRIIATGVEPQGRDHTGRAERGAVDGRGNDRGVSSQLQRARRGLSVLEVRLHTGRRNQIRLHCQLEGMPLIGERQYLPEGGHRGGPTLRRQALHAIRLGLRHPRSGAKLTFEAPLPADLQTLLHGQKSKGSTRGHAHRSHLEEHVGSRSPAQRSPATKARAATPQHPPEAKTPARGPHDSIDAPKKVRRKPRRAKSDLPAKLIKKAKRAKKRSGRRRKEAPNTDE